MTLRFKFVSISHLIRRLLPCGLLLSLCLSLVACQAPKAKQDIYQDIVKRGYLRVGTTYTSPPQGFLDNNGVPQGLDIELAHKLAQQILGKADAVKFIEVQNANRLSYLNTHQVDFILGGFSITEARKKHFAFSKPYMESSFRILVHDDSAIHSKYDLIGKKVCFMFGGTSEGILKRHMPKGVHLIGFHALADEMQAFRHKQIDGLAQQEGVLTVFMREQCGARLLPEKLEVASYAVAYEKSPYSEKIRAIVQTKLDAMAQSGEIKRLQEKWIAMPLDTKCTTAH